MTQDQCLDNGHHQAAGSSHSANDKTSDDPNSSNNSILKSGINTAQEFNVDVNSKRIDQQSADVVIVRNFGLDTDRSSTDNNGLTTSDNSLDLTSNSVDSTGNIISNAIDNSLATKMTVITHQSSDENIREIILHPDDLNKIPNDSQENTKGNLINEQSYNKPNSKDKNTPQIRRDVRKNSETEKPEDPIERLNKLRASISSALSEVKGVLKQYSTEQSFDEGESESSQSSKPPDDGPVRFRFVRKIRRRSVYSEEPVDGTLQNQDTPSTREKQAGTESGNGQTASAQVQAEKLQSSNAKKDDNGEVAAVSALDNDAKLKDMVPKASEENRNKSNLPVAESSQVAVTSENNTKHNSSDVVNKKMKMVDDSINLNNIRKPLDAAAKTTKPKKLIKKDRRASVTLANTTPQLELKAQRRPSDSGTIVKHAAGIKSKTGGRAKSTAQRNSSIKAIDEAATPVIVNTQVTPKQVTEPQKVDTISNGFIASSTADTSSESNKGPTDQASIITEGSANTEAVSHLKDSLDEAALLETTKPDVPQKKEENNEPASQTDETAAQVGQGKSNSPVDAGPKHHQNTEVVNDVKANTQDDITPEMDNNSKPSNSEDKPEIEGETASTPAVEEETKPPAVVAAPVKSKKKAKRKVVIRRIKRKLSKDDTFIQIQETPSELEIEEKEIQEQDDNDDAAGEAEEAPKQRKPCIKARQFEIGDIVMYAERYKKTQVKWRKAKIVERITSISYKLDIEGEEIPAHISYIKKFTDRKVNFGGKEYLEIDYAQIEEDEEKERNYSIWNMV